MEGANIVTAIMGGELSAKEEFKDLSSPICYNEN